MGTSLSLFVYIIAYGQTTVNGGFAKTEARETAGLGNSIYWYRISGIMPCLHAVINAVRTSGFAPIRVRQELVEKLDTLSATSGYSRNELIGLLLEYAVKNCEVKENPPQA